MRGFEITGVIDVTVATPRYIIRLASPQPTDPPVGGVFAYDMPRSWSFDFNLVTTGNGQLNIYLSNDDPSVSTYVASPVYIYPITAGQFANNTTKLTLDSGFKVTTKYMFAKFVPSGTVTGLINIQGTILY